MFKEKIKKRLARLFKLRFAVLYPLVAWAIVFSHSTNESIRHSLVLILMGLAMRSWANCYAIKGEKLTTSGPYAHVRHPLYFGSFLIMTGLLVLLNVHWVVSLTCALVVIGIVYKRTIQKEEVILAGRFGQSFEDYRRSVPAIFPTWKKYQGGQKWPPSLERYLRSQEYKLVIWVFILVMAFHLKDEFLVEQESLNFQNGIFIIIIFMLASLDLILEIVRKRRKNT